MVSGGSELMRYKVTNLKTQVLPLHLTGVTLDKSIKHDGLSFLTCKIWE